MRSSIGLLMFIGFGAVSAAFADPPASQTATTATAAPTAQAAAPAQPAAASSATPAAPKAAAAEAAASTGEDERERHFLSEGYRLEMRNGDKVFCRREAVLGSRLGAQKVCSSAQQLTETERQARAAVTHGNMGQTNPVGH